MHMPGIAEPGSALPFSSGKGRSGSMFEDAMLAAQKDLTPGAKTRNHLGLTRGHTSTRVSEYGSKARNTDAFLDQVINAIETPELASVGSKVPTQMVKQQEPQYSDRTQHE